MPSQSFYLGELQYQVSELTCLLEYMSAHGMENEPCYQSIQADLEALHNRIGPMWVL